MSSQECLFLVVNITVYIIYSPVILAMFEECRHFPTCMISGFHRGVIEVCVIVGCYST